MRKVLLFLKALADVDGPDQEDARIGLLKILDAYLPSEGPIYRKSPATWAPPEDLQPLINQYSDVLDVQIGFKKRDYLVWEAMDVRHEFGRDSIEVGDTHRLLALLMLEGVLPDTVTANWDGLIEKAVEEASHGQLQVSVGIENADFRNTFHPPHLIKMHGCAVRAANDESHREFLVAAQSSIAQWLAHGRFENLRRDIERLAGHKRALFLGLSVQDANMLALFGRVCNTVPWPWESHHPAYVFAEPHLETPHTAALRTSYGDNYDLNVQEIEEGSIFGDYAAPVVAALLIDTISRKLHVLLERALGVRSRQAEIDHYSAGIRAVEEVMVGDLGNTVDAVVEWAGVGLRNLVCTFQGDGSDLTAMPQGYMPIAWGTVPHLRTLPIGGLAGAGELALMMALVGMGSLKRTWEFEFVRGDVPAAGTLILKSGDRAVGLTFVRDHVAWDALMKSPFWSEAQGELAILRVGSSPEAPPSRGLAMSLGSGRAAPTRRREIWLDDVMSRAQGAESAAISFQQEVGL